MQFSNVDYSLLEQLPVGVFITDTELNVIFWNKKLEVWTTKRKSDVLGKQITELYPHLTQKNYQIRIRDVVQGGPAVIFSSQLHPYFIPVPLSDGTFRVQNTTLTRNLSPSGQYYLVFTIQDITDTHRHLEKIKDLRKKALDEIQERERIQQQLHESREMLASINRNISEGIFRLNPKIGITYANNALVTLLGYNSVEELIGTNPLHTHILSSNRDRILEQLENKERFIYEEIRLKRNDNTLFWGQLSITTTLYQATGEIYADCLISDITTKKMQMQRIQESEEQYRNLFQNSMVGMYRIAIKDGKIITVNKKGLEIFGFSSFEEIQSHHLYRDETDWAKLKDILIKKKVLDELEVQLRKNDNSLFWASISAKLNVKEGYIEGVVLDIEERKQAEILQAALYRIADRSNALTDIKQFFSEIHQIVNELMEANNFYIAEYDSIKDLIIFSYLEDDYDKIALPKKPAKGVTEYIIRTGEPLLATWDEILELNRKGEIEIVGAPAKQFLGVPLRSASKIIGVLAVQSYLHTDAYTERELEVLTFVAQHVTTALERRRYEYSLLDAKNIAEQASKSKSLFLANMSHELRTPLNSIIGFNRRVIKRLESGSDKQSIQALETVQRNALNLLKLINDVLDISKVEAGKLSYSIKVVNLQEIILDIINDLEPLATQKNIELRFINSNEPIFGKTDSFRLRQILLNIIGNGIKFTDDGNVTVELGIVQFSGNQYVRISISDTGIGIDHDKQHLIFELFEQVDRDKDRSRGGTGLGLAISKKMINDMGGEIQVKSEYGFGSTFNVYIPTQQSVKSLTN